MTIRRHHLPTYAAAAFCAALAAGRAGAQAPAAAAGRNSGKEYVLKNVSSFTPPPIDSRNPFWPIGWVPTVAAPTAAGPAPVVDVRADMFTVTSISVDYPPLAVINGQTKGIGEQMPVPGGTAGAQTFVKVKKIADGVVVLDYKGRELTLVPTIPGAGRKK